MILPVLLALVFSIYLPGLSGGFYFDDFVHIVQNETLLLDNLDWAEFRLASLSSNSGPLGRPLPMATFAVESYLWGVTPYHFKLVNLLIHLCNGVLVFALFLRIWKASLSHGEVGSGAVSGYARLLTYLFAAWWLLHPLNVTAVLYVVQRMTSLSAMFSLLALLGYVECRVRGGATNRNGWWLLGFGALLMGTVASAYSKENGLLTPVFAWLIEVLIFRCRMPSTDAQRRLRLACMVMPLVGLFGVAVYFAGRPDWAASAYSGRPFSLSERVMTEARVVWFYIRQLLLPHSASFGLYLDGFPLSKGMLQPWVTLPAIIGHLMLVLLAMGFWRRLPLLTLGILLFYCGHAVESTLIPLEIAFEHRNYLPGLGILLAVMALLGQIPGTYRRLAVGVLVIMISLSTWITAQRAISMGNAVFYPVLEAENHPGSSRANFDAGRSLLGVIEANPTFAEEYYPKARAYFDRAIREDEHALAPFTGVMALLYVTKKAMEPELLRLFEHRLRYGVPSNSSGYIGRALTNQLSFDRSIMSHADGERLFKAALDNPKLKGNSRVVWRIGYAMFVSNVIKDPGRGLGIMQQTIEAYPFNPELKLMTSAMLVDLDRLDEARILLNKADENDKRGFLDKPISGMRLLIDARRKSKDIRAP